MLLRDYLIRHHAGLSVSSSPTAITCHRGQPLRPLLVPIERIAPGIPQDDNLVQEVTLFLGGEPRPIPCDQLVPNSTADERSRPCGLHIALLIGLHK